MQRRVRNYRQLHESSELLWEKLEMLSGSKKLLFHERLLSSWIYHDFALEGTVLAEAHIKAGIDVDIISSPSLIPAYNDIVSMSEAIGQVLATREKRLTPSLEWLKHLHLLLLPANKKDEVQYRKVNPVHRMYFHDLARADKISYRMRKLTDWFRTESCKRTHPVELAVEVHREVIRVYPWPETSGRVARLAMNHILCKQGYWPAIIHATDRQRYYEVLRGDLDKLLGLALQSMEQGIRAGSTLYQEIVDSDRSPRGPA
jgi:hypothetical protein